MSSLTPEERAAILRRIAEIKAQLEALPKSRRTPIQQAARLKELGEELIDLERRLREGSD